MCDFDDDFGDDFEDDGFMDEGQFNDALPGNNDPLQDDAPDESCGPGWEDIALINAISDELAEERRRREQIEKENFEGKEEE